MRQTIPPTNSKFIPSLVIVSSVALTILLGFFLAQSDQQLLPTPTAEQISPAAPSPTPAVVAVGTVVVLATATPLPPTATSLPVVPEATLTAGQPFLTAENGNSCGVVPPTWQRYTIQPGDTLHNLAVRSGATVAEIRQVNCMELNVIYVGREIYLPIVPPTRIPCGPPAEWTLYTVARGETMFSLALRYGTTVYALMVANCLTTPWLVAGRQIYVPYLPPTATSTPVPPPPPPPPTATYTPEPPATDTPTLTVEPATPTPTPTASATATAVPPTSTFTPVPPTATPEPPTVTSEPTATLEPTPTLTPSILPTQNS